MLEILQKLADNGDQSNNAKKKIAIVVFSVFGNTLRVGQAIQDVFRANDINCELHNLAGKTWEDINDFDYSLIENLDLLVIGSPVYAWNIIAPLKLFIKNLPFSDNAKVALFITYGLITGNIFLDTTKLLQKRGYKTIMGLKVASRHSMIFEEERDIF